MKFFPEPLVHFLVIGAAIFVLFGFFGRQDVEEQERAITITAGEIGWLTDSWEKRWNRPPTAEEREGLIKQYLREMMPLKHQTHFYLFLKFRKHWIPDA